ncbi:AraC family transcriptional regulator [Pontimicrobium aquaticum]|uniref:AraC family transcriptional regulator n=1 Tax=Pontimicrobium aquaticum TaxID=2565367 RepID=A0A4U0F0D5_9FLAO|nr:helix-turn-helix domain-containing protein [Pontimicrobium aquaticum]TJY37827.1 AraC family transcriptional regulator [Pontimicrobium aquaticum]
MGKDITLLLNIIGVGNLFLLSIFQLTSRGKKHSSQRYFLSAIFFILSWITLNTILNHSGYSELFYGFETISNAFMFILASTLYVYVKTLFKEVNLQEWLKHLIPFFCYFFLVVFSLIYSFNIFGYNSQSVLEGMPYQVVWNLYFAIYLFKIFFLVKRGKQKLSFFSRVLIFGVSLSWGVNLLIFLYRHIFNPLPSSVYLNITLFFTGISIIYLYATLKKVPQKRTSFANTKLEIEIDPDTLVKTIIEQKIYENADLNIRVLSDKINMPYYKVSAFIHTAFNQNFNEFINSIRVKEFIKEIRQNSHQSLTIKGLANKVGFKSTSAFYKAFKKETGTTPSKYIDTL